MRAPAASKKPANRGFTGGQKNVSRKGLPRKTAAGLAKTLGIAGISLGSTAGVHFTRDAGEQEKETIELFEIHSEANRLVEARRAKRERLLEECLERILPNEQVKESEDIVKMVRLKEEARYIFGEILRTERRVPSAQEIQKIASRFNQQTKPLQAKYAI